MNKWEKYKIHELGSVVTGSTPKTTIEEYWNGNIPFVSPTDMKGYKNIVNTERTVTIDGAQTGRLIPKGSLMVTCIASIGKMAISDRECITNQQINTIIPNNKCTVDYLYYALLKNIDRLKLFSGTTAVPIINKSTFEQFELEIPPLREQQKIAEILSSVDAAIEKTEQVIAKTEEVKKGLMQQLLTKGIGHTEFKQTEIGEIPVEWELIKIQKLLDLGILDSIQDGNHGEKHPKSSDYCDEGIPFIMANDLINGDIDFAKCKKIPKSIADNLRIGFSRENDILLTHKATIGKVAIVPNIKDYVMLTPQVTYYRIKKQENLIPSFLKYYFESSKFQKELEVMSKQSTRSYIGITNQKKLSILLPSIEEQTSIVEILDTIVLKQKKEENKLQQLKIIKNGLMQQLLTGQVRIKID